MGRIRGLKLLAVLGGAAVLATVGLSPVRAQEKADPKAVAFFEEKIRPILANNCVGCHGPEKQKAGMRMDTREWLMKGTNEEGHQHSVVEPGNPDKSAIIEAIGYKNEDIQMPPPKKGKSMKLTDEQIKAMTEWVKMGVPYGEKPVEAPKVEEAK